MVAISVVLAVLSVVADAIAVPTPSEEIEARNLTTRGPTDFVLNPELGSLFRRSSINYHQDYTSGGTVNYSPSSSGFYVQWNTQNDFVVGVGWNPGNTMSVEQAPPV
jgi:endo-1,4-beta-xylanase